MENNADTIIAIKGLGKIYAGGHVALDDINLDIKKGEILALLGPNGAGKTTLISAICGLLSPTSGSVTVGGFDIIKDFRRTRELIGLVPQELTLGAFELVFDTVSLSRGMFGKKPDPDYINELLKKLSLGDKTQAKVMMLSGGMKRRVLIAKALSHQPRILFLDEPTAGVDVELRKEMWEIVEELRNDGVTIILTTHYIEEAEEIADRIGVINNGKLLLVEDKDKLMDKMGSKTLVVELKDPITEIPASLAQYNLVMSAGGYKLSYEYDTTSERTGITRLLSDLNEAGLSFKDLATSQSSLEDIFVELVGTPS